MIDYTVLQNNEGEFEIEIVQRNNESMFNVSTLYKQQTFLVSSYAYDTNTKEYLPLFKKVYLNENSNIVVVMNPAFDNVGEWEDEVLKIIGVQDAISK